MLHPTRTVPKAVGRCRHASVFAIWLQELLKKAKIDPAAVAAFVELHIEQGKVELASACPELDPSTRLPRRFV